MAKRLQKRTIYRVDENSGEVFKTSFFYDDTRKGKNPFKFTNTLKLLIMISLAVLLFSWGSFGYIDSSYLSAKNNYTYNAYVIDDNNNVSIVQKTDTLYDYDWTFKINQLSGLRNVFTVPNLNNDTFYQKFSPSNMILVENLVKEGFISNANMTSQDYYNTTQGINDMKYNNNSYLGSSLYSIFKPFSVAYSDLGNVKVLRFINYDKSTIEYKLNTSSFFSNYSYEQYLNLKDYLNPMLLYAYIENSNVVWRSDMITDTRDDFTHNVNKVFSLLMYPFTIVYNFVYDFGVLFNFALVW